MRIQLRQRSPNDRRVRLFGCWRNIAISKNRRPGSASGSDRFSLSANVCLRHLTNGRDLTLSLRLVVLAKVTVNSNVWAIH